MQQSQADSNVLSQHFEESRTKLSEEVSGHKRSREELRHQLGETVREAVSGRGGLGIYNNDTHT